MIDDLIKAKYDPDPVLAWQKQLQKGIEELEGGEEEEEEVAPEDAANDDVKAAKAKDKEKKSEYDYLLGMQLWSLTLERKEALLKDRDNKVRFFFSIQTGQWNG